MSLPSTSPGALPPDIKAQLLRSLQEPSLEELVRLFNANLGDVTRNEVTKHMLQAVTAALADAAASRGLSYVQSVFAALSGLASLKVVAFAVEVFDLETLVADCCEQHREYKVSQDISVRFLHAPSNVVTCVEPKKRLHCCASILRCCEHTGDTALADEAAAKGLTLYRQLCRQPPPVSQAEVAALSQLLCSFLTALGVSLRSREKFAEASKVFYDRFLRRNEQGDLVRAVVCALLTEAGPQRAGQLSVLHLTPDSAQLGKLNDVLTKAFRSQVLTSADEACLAEHAPDSSPRVVKKAIREHNIHAISRVYNCISVPALGQLLGGIPDDEVIAMVASMASQKRLSAKVDQKTGWVVFRVHESAAALAEWDEKIGYICNGVSFATDRITRRYPQYNSLLTDAAP